MSLVKEKFNEARLNLLQAWRAPKDWISKTVFGAGVAWYIVDIPFPDISGEIALFASTAYVVRRSFHISKQKEQQRTEKLEQALETALTNEARVNAVKQYVEDAFYWGKYIPHFLSKHAEKIDVQIRQASSEEDALTDITTKFWNDFQLMSEAPADFLARRQNKRPEINATVSSCNSIYNVTIQYNYPERKIPRLYRASQRSIGL